MKEKFSHIRDVLKIFLGGENRQPPEIEYYILKSMWVMMVAEFEGSVKELAEDYIDKIKEYDIKTIHPCILLTCFKPDNKNSSPAEKFIEVYDKDPKKIDYKYFTRNNISKYNQESIIKLFNSLGITFIEEEEKELGNLNGIAQIRNSIAHGNKGTNITEPELREELKYLESIYEMLQNKLDFTGKGIKFI